MASSNHPAGKAQARSINQRGKAQNIPPGTFRRTMSLLKPYRATIAMVCGFILLGVAANVLAPMLAGRATNVLFEGFINSQIPANFSDQQVAQWLADHNLQNMARTINIQPGSGIDFGTLGQIILIVVLAYATAGLFQWLAGITIRGPVQKMGRKLRQDIQRKIDRLPLSYLDQTSRGDMLSRVGNDVDNITQSLSQSFNQVLQSIVSLVGTAAIMLYLSWRLSLLAFVLIPIGLVLTLMLIKKSSPQFAEQWKATGEVSAKVEDTFSGHQVMIAYGLEDKFAAEFSTSNTDLFKAAYKAQFLSGMVRPVMSFFTNLSFVGLAILGSISALNGAITIGMVQAFLQYSRLLSQPIETLAGMANVFQSTLASAARVFEFLDADEMEAESDKPDLSAQPITHIQFDHVDFSYDAGKPVINDLCLEVQQGQSVAIVGPTGAGKTTLINLLMRFYEIDSGQILLNGQDAQAVNKDSLRRHFAMVLQDTWLFRGTIAENIGFGNSNASREQIEQAGRACSVDSMIRAFPNGYDTVIGEDGDGISAGQRQLITIARAFLANRDVLILDEATSNVDTRTEVRVQKAMNRLREGKTTFVIAHRLSTIRDADKIIVVDHGDIVEQGTHEELLANPDGPYTKLYESQFKNLD